MPPVSLQPNSALAAHARAVRDRQGSRADVAVHDAALVQLDALRPLDVSLDLARDHDRACAHGAGEMCAGLDGQRSVDLDVALEAAGDPHMAGAFDLAFEGQARGDDRLLEFLAASAGAWRGGSAGARHRFGSRPIDGRRAAGGRIGLGRILGDNVLPDGHGESSVGGR